MAKPPIPSIKFFMPVAKDSSVTSAQVALGRDFRQPFNFDNLAASHARGLELLLQNASPAANFYAFMDGSLRFVPAKPPNDAALALDIDPGLVDTVKGVFFKRTIESAPMRALYENFDQTQTRAALATLLNDASHRSHKGSVTQIVDGKPKSIKLDDLIKSEGVDGVLDQFFGGQVDLPLLMSAGDLIGVAGPTTPPSGQRRLIWSLLDLGQQHLNPFFYLQTFLAAVPAEGLTLGAPAAPLAALIPSTPVPPRVSINVPDGSATSPQIPFPFGPHADYHGYPLEGGVGLPQKVHVTHSLALQERRFAPPGTANVVVGQFQARKVSDQSEVQFYKDTTSRDKRMADVTRAIKSLWARVLPETNGQPLSTVINGICAVLGMPAEIFLMILGHESGGKGLAYRIEPLKDDERKALRAAHSDGVLELKYDQTVGFPGSITTVNLEQAPGALSAAPFETDGRPQSTVHVTLSEKLNPALTKDSKGLLITSAPKKKAADAETEDNHKRRFLIVDSATGFRPLIRDITLNGTSATDFDIKIDDEQFFCNRGAVDPEVTNLVCAGGTAQTDDSQDMTNGIHYDPADSCQVVAGSATLTNAVQHTIARPGTLRALYVEASAKPKADVTVTVKVNGTASKDLVVVLTKDSKRASKANGTEATAVSSGDKISIFVQGNSVVTGLRVRLHLAPKENTTAYIIHGVGGGIVNTYPTTGPDLASNVNGPQGNTVHPLLWGDLLEVIQTAEGKNISPGVSQTLISTAHNTLIKLEKMFPDLYTRLAPFGVTARPPADDHEFKRYVVDDRASPPLGWLMLVPNALLVGAAFIKFAYTGKVGLPSLFDIPAVCAAYNQGSVAFSTTKGKGKGQVATPVSSPWGLLLKQPKYVPDGATVFNAIVALFEGAAPNTQPLSPIPQVRFRS